MSTRKRLQGPSSQLTDRSLTKYAEIEPWLHAFSWMDENWVRRCADEVDAREIPPRSPIVGLPVGVKDVFDTAGIPTEFGSKAFAGRVPSSDATVIQRLREAGAIVFGKTVTAELAYYQPGPTVNPWNRNRTPGGSSMGSAAAVAAGIVPLAIGTQTNGSVIRPAAFCGVVGFKPSAGLIPMDGALIFSHSLDQAGVFARNVPEAAALASVLAGRRMRAVPGSNVYRFCALPEALVGGAEAAMITSFNDNLSVLRSCGATVDTLPSSPEGLAEASRAHRTIMAVEAYWSLTNAVSGRMDVIGDQLQRLLSRGRAVSWPTYTSAVTARRRLRRSFQSIMRSFDALLTLPAPGEAPGLETTGDPRFCTPWTLVGAPCITLPTSLGPGRLPLGLQVVGKVGRDSELLAAASWIAARLPSPPSLTLD